MSWLREFFSNDPEALSYRRGTGFVAFLVFIFGHFVVLFFARVVTNAPLFEHSQEWLAIMVMAMVAGITVDRFARRPYTHDPSRIKVDDDAAPNVPVPTPYPAPIPTPLPEPVPVPQPVTVKKKSVRTKPQQVPMEREKSPKKKAQKAKKGSSASGTPLKTSSGARRQGSTATKSSTTRTRK